MSEVRMSFSAPDFGVTVNVHDNDDYGLYNFYDSEKAAKFCKLVKTIAFSDWELVADKWAALVEAAR